MFSIDLNIQGFITKAITFAIRALRSAPVAAKQYTILDLIKILFYLFKKVVYAQDFATPLP